jgi:hypothetical protein
LRGNKFLRCGRRRLVSTFVEKEQSKTSRTSLSAVLFFVREGGRSASAPTAQEFIPTLFILIQFFEYLTWFKENSSNGI